MRPARRGMGEELFLHPPQRVADPGELRNLAGDPAHAVIEQELKVALSEKMVLDWDFLPTPLR